MRIKQRTINHSPATDTAIRVVKNAIPADFYRIPEPHGRECLKYKAFSTYRQARRYAGANGIVFMEMVEGLPPITIDSPYDITQLDGYGLPYFTNVFVGVRVTR